MSQLYAIVLANVPMPSLQRRDLNEGQLTSGDRGALVLKNSFLIELLEKLWVRF